MHFPKHCTSRALLQQVCACLRLSYGSVSSHWRIHGGGGALGTHTLGLISSTFVICVMFGWIIFCPFWFLINTTINKLFFTKSQIFVLHLHACKICAYCGKLDFYSLLGSSTTKLVTQNVTLAYKLHCNKVLASRNFRKIPDRGWLSQAHFDSSKKNNLNVWSQFFAGKLVIKV